MAEMYTLKPIFCGKTSLDQLTKYCKILGTSEFMQWKEGVKISQNMGFEIPEYDHGCIADKLVYSSSDALNLIKSMLQFNPCKRIKIYEILEHPFFGVSKSGLKLTKVPVLQSVPSKNQLSTLSQNDEPIISNSKINILTQTNQKQAKKEFEMNDLFPVEEQVSLPQLKPPPKITKESIRALIKNKVKDKRKFLNYQKLSNVKESENETSINNGSKRRKLPLKFNHKRLKSTFEMPLISNIPVETGRKNQTKIDIRLKSSETHGDLSRIDNIEKYYSNLLQKNDESNAYDEQYAAVRPSYRLASTSEATFDRYGQKIMDQLDILQK